MTALHLEQSICLEYLGGTGAFLVFGVFHYGSEEVEEDRSRPLDVVHTLLEQCQEERRHGQPGMVASVLVVLNLIDDAPVQRLGLVELAGFDEIASKVVSLGLPNLCLEFIRTGTGEGRRQLATGTTLLLPGDRGVILEAAVDPMLATLVEYAMGSLLMRISRIRIAW